MMHHPCISVCGAEVNPVRLQASLPACRCCLNQRQRGLLLDFVVHFGVGNTQQQRNGDRNFGNLGVAENNAAFDIALDALENYNDVAIKMSGNGEPMATEEPAEASPSSTKITFENVRIQSLSEDAGAKDKYPGDNNKIRVEYDPEVSASRSNQESLP